MKQLVAAIVLVALNVFMLFLGSMAFVPLVGEDWWAAISFVESLIAGWWIASLMCTWYFAERDLKRMEKRL